MLASLATASSLAAGYSLSFNGTASGDVDRVKVRVDDPATALPGGPVDVGAGNFTIEFWLGAVQHRLGLAVVPAIEMTQRAETADLDGADRLRRTRRHLASRSSAKHAGRVRHVD